MKSFVQQLDLPRTVVNRVRFDQAKQNVSPKFRRGYGDTVDAGWKMGADVPLFDNVRNSPAIERVTVRGQQRNLPKNPSLGSMSSGGLY